MTDPARQGDRALSPGRKVWLWPVAAAALSAWPVWRSIAPETPDIGEGWLRLELLLGLALAVLYCAWAWPMRRRVRGLVLPFWVMLLAANGVIATTRSGEVIGADLCVLVIAWTATTTIFSTLVLLQIEEAGTIAGCKAPHHQDLTPPIPWLGAAYSVVLLAITLLFYFLPKIALAMVAMGVVSPGAILAWASLSDTARSALAKRRVHFSAAGFLTDLAKLRFWALRSPAILVSDRPKLVSLYPADGVKPGDLVALAVALTMDDDSDFGRAVQEFGVSHRIRIPALKQVQGVPTSAGRQAILQDGTRVELRDPATLAAAEFDLAPFAEPMALAQSLRRSALAVVERQPRARPIGLLVFAIAARPGAAEALLDIRSRGIAVALTTPARDARDELVLKSLQVAPGGAAGGDSDESVCVVRHAQALADTQGLVLQFGAARSTASPPIAHVIAAREDARVLADLACFAADFRARTLIVTLLANAPGWALIAAVFGDVPLSPLLVTGVAVIGIALAVASPQVLRLSPTLAKEVDEE